MYFHTFFSTEKSKFILYTNSFRLFYTQNNNYKETNTILCNLCNLGELNTGFSKIYIVNMYS